MYQHILLAVALQQWDEFSPHAVAVREAAVAVPPKRTSRKLRLLCAPMTNTSTPSASAVATISWRGFPTFNNGVIEVL